MGFNTALMILNDAADGLKDNPDVGTSIYNALLESQRGKPVDFSIKSYANGGVVLPSHHADVVQLIAVGGNDMTPVVNLYGAWREMSEPEELLRRFADQLGFRIVRKSK